ncbi:Xylooligosaccharide oxidase [Paramyrothecium foliicola]|nr:Xylooligosaccharide oxidase [Paramyrothecium foliicola]
MSIPQPLGTMHLSVLLLSAAAALPSLVSAADPAVVGACLTAAGVTYFSGNPAQWNGVDRSLFNARFAYKPLLIVQPTTVAHIQSAVSCGVQNGARVVAKSGGHGYSSHGFGGEDGQLVIDLAKMKTVTVGANSVAKIQGGARLGHVATELFNQGRRAIAHGTCPAVGIGGHATGGGYGMASHSHGLTLDWLAGATVVLANATVVHTSATENPDLLWALRGGGSAFGIVAEFEFNTFAAPSQVTYYSVNTNWWNEAAAVAGLKAVQEFAVTDMPTSLNLRVQIDGGGRRLEGVYYGTSDQLRAILNPWLGRFNGNINQATTVGWLEAIRQYAWADLITPENYNQHEVFYASSLTTNALNDAQLQSFVHHLFTGIQVGSNRNWWLQMDIHGGPSSAISQVPVANTAYAHRNKLLLWQLYDRATSGAYPSNGFSTLQGIAASATQGMSSSDWGMYINYQDSQVDTQTAQQKYWGSNLAKLQRIKKQLDPNQVFWNPQSVRPAA